MMKLYALGLGAFGLFLVVGGLKSIAGRYALQRRGVRAPGVIVDNAKDGAKNVTYSPIVEFSTKEGKHRIQATTWSHEPFDTGKSVEVVYVPDHPDNADISGGEESLSGPIVIVVLGVLFLIGGIGGFLLMR